MLDLLKIIVLYRNKMVLSMVYLANNGERAITPIDPVTFAPVKKLKDKRLNFKLKKMAAESPKDVQSCAQVTRKAGLGTNLTAGLMTTSKYCDSQTYNTTYH